jgi:hypothetical protein
VPQIELLFRASRDGYGADNFHRCCDNKGPTLTIAKSRRGFVFGGYADRPWTSNGSGQYCASPQAFLFGLYTNTGQGPFKLGLGGLHSDGKANAVYNSVNNGPTFGAGYDLCIVSNPNSSTCSSNLGHTYANPPGGQYGTPSSTECFAEARSFHLLDYEVFSVL